MINQITYYIKESFYHTVEANIDRKLLPHVCVDQKASKIKRNPHDHKKGHNIQ